MKAFWLLTGASAASTLGNTFLFLAVPLILLDHTGSPMLAVLSMAARTAPYVLAPLLGAFIDRHDRRAMFAAADIVQAAAIAAIPLLLTRGAVQVVFLALFVQGLANVVSNVAGAYGLIPALVPAEQLDQASSRFTTILLIARFAGPALAGVVIAGLGTTWALELDALTFLLTAATVVFMPRMRPQQIRSPLRRMLLDGIAHFRQRPDLRRLTLVVAVYNLGAGALEPTLLAVGGERWGWSAGPLGIAVSCAAVGAALGAWLSPHTLIGGDRHRQLFLWLAVSAVGAAALLLAWPYAVIAGFVVLSFGEGGINTATLAYRQQTITPELAGRVNTIIRCFITGAVPASALLLGLTASVAGDLLVFVPVTVTAVLACWLWWVRTPAHDPAPAQTAVP